MTQSTRVTEAEEAWRALRELALTAVGFTRRREDLVGWPPHPDNRHAWWSRDLNDVDPRFRPYHMRAWLERREAAARLTAAAAHLAALAYGLYLDCCRVCQHTMLNLHDDRKTCSDKCRKRRSRERRAK